MRSNYITRAERKSIQNFLTKIHKLLQREEILPKNCKLSFITVGGSSVFYGYDNRIVIDTYQPWTRFADETLLKIFTKVYCHEAGHAIHRNYNFMHYAEMTVLHNESRQILYDRYGFETVKSFHRFSITEKIADEFCITLYKQLQEKFPLLQ